MRFSRFLCGLLSLSLLIGLPACGGNLKESGPQRTLRPAVVAAVHPEAARAGIEMFEQGGNAVDAACAVGFALAVVFPEAGNLGGGGFMVLRTPEGEEVAIDFREMAPARAHKDVYLDEEKNVIPDMSLFGWKAVGVPGTVKGLAFAAEEYGELSLKTILKPAIRLASEGFEVTPRLESSLQGLLPAVEELPYSRKLVTRPDGTAYVKGDTWKQPELARTLRLIAEEGAETFYSGTIAKEIAARYAEEGDGWITLDDLKNYRAVKRDPIRVTYRDHDIISMPPPSSGGIAIGQILGILEGFDLAKTGHNTASTMHLMVEAERRVYADRSKHLGDADFYAVPKQFLLSEDYLAARREEIDPEAKTPSKEVEPGNPDDYKIGGNTTHYSVIGPDGFAVSTTVTLNTRYGAKVATNGFFLNNEMNDFSSKPGVPNYFGLVGAEANAIAPSKRPLSSMSPTIVVDGEGDVRLVVGSPGGSTIITTVTQVILNVLEHGLGPEEAVRAPRFHHQWLPDKVFVEKDRFPKTTLKDLESYGHELATDRWPSIGDVHAIIRDEETGKWVGVADTARRGDGTVLKISPGRLKALTN